MPRRGEVYWVELDPILGSEIGKTRPCVVVTNDIANERRRTVVVVPLSTSPTSAPPLLVPVECDGRPAVAVIDQIRAVAKLRLRGKLGDLSWPDMAAIEAAMRRVFDLN